MNKRFLLSIILFSVVFLILCIEAVAENMDQRNDIVIPALSISQELNEDKELNQSEKVILSLLTAVFTSSGSSQEKETGNFDLYEEYLHKHLTSPGIRLTSSKADEAINKIIELEAVFNIEQVHNINTMSVDSRELAIRLSKEIYEACGLKLSYDMQGAIIRITDKSDNLIYLNPDTVQHTVKYGGLRLDLLIITLSIISVLLFICVLIARKNQLYQQEPGYEGFNEEGFVQSIHI